MKFLSSKSFSCVMIVLLVVFTSTTVVAGPPSPINPTGSAQNVKERKRGGQDAAAAMDGISIEYRALDGTPIFFDPEEENGLDRKRRYPMLNALEGSLIHMVKNNEISVDDEIDKAAMVAYQTVDSIMDSFVSGEKKRDRFLDMFSTVRGIAMLTLAYLDKTVSAELGNVLHQAQQDAQMALSKHIAWSTKKLSDPDRKHMHDQVDEKYEMCIAKRRSVRTERNFDYMSYSDVGDEGNSPGEAGESYCAKLHDPDLSTFHYCQCVAQTSTLVHQSVTGRENADARYWSVVERVFYGLKMPEGTLQTPAGNNAATEVEWFGKFFRALYGDILLHPVPGDSPGAPVAPGAQLPDVNCHRVGSEDSSSNADAQAAQSRACVKGKLSNLMANTFYPNALSVPDSIEWLRNGPPQRSTGSPGDSGDDGNLVNEDEAANSGGARLADPLGGGCILDPYGSGKQEFAYCPITGLMVENGICPSLKALIRLRECYGVSPDGRTPYEIKRDNNGPVSLPSGNGPAWNAGACVVSAQDKSAPFAQVWAEAGLGGGFDLRDIDNLLAKKPFKEGEVVVALSRVVEEWCDASAVNAYKRLHLRMSSIALDHLALNTKATKADKEMIIKLLSRVSNIIDLGFQDAHSSTTGLKLALSVERERRDAAVNSANVAVMQARQNLNQATSQFNMFGQGR